MDTLTIKSSDWNDITVEIGADDELYIEIHGAHESYTWLTREEGERIHKLLSGWLNK